MSEQRQRIEAARAYAGLSQEKLAQAIEMSEATFKRRLSGAYRFKRSELREIAQVTAVPLWFLRAGWDGHDAAVELESDLASAVQQAESSDEHNEGQAPASENP